MFEFDTHEAIVLDLVNSTKSSLYSILVADGHPRSKIPALKDALDVTSFALSQIAAILEPLKAKVQVLHDSYNQLLDRQTNAVNYISLSCVPDDILTDIMLLSMPEGGPSLHRPSPFPLNLSKVCKRWRSLVFSDPRLWSSFQIEISETQDHQLEGYFALHPDHDLSHVRISRTLDLFHTKSMASPLAVRLTLASWTFGTAATDLLRQMAAHSERWKALRLQAQQPGIQIFSEVFSNRLPTVQMLNLVPLYLRTSSTMPIANVTSPSLPVFPNLPALKHLILRHPIPSSFTLPWRQLQTLEYQQFGENIGTILSKTCSLVKLSLGNGDQFVSLKTSGSKVILTHLRCLTLVDDILDILITPSLQCLSVSFYLFRTQQVEEMCSCLSRFESLVGLRLTAYTQTIAQFYHYLGDPNFLPHLRTLRICHVTYSTPGLHDTMTRYPVALRNALQARGQTSCPPLFVDLYIPPSDLISPSWLACISENPCVRIITQYVWLFVRFPVAVAEAEDFDSYSVACACKLSGSQAVGFASQSAA